MFIKLFMAIQGSHQMLVIASFKRDTRHDLNLCTGCGKEALEEIIVPFDVEYGGKKKTLQDKMMRCSMCESISYQGSQISEHERAIAAAKRELGGLLSPDDLLNIRLKYRFKQTDMEQMLSTGPKTWTRWERGKVTHSRAADTLIRVMAEYPDVARKLMEQAGVVNAEATAIFDQIDEDAKRIARVALAKLGAGETMTHDMFLDRFSDEAFEQICAARKQAASNVKAG